MEAAADARQLDTDRPPCLWRVREKRQEKKVKKRKIQREEKERLRNCGQNVVENTGRLM